MNYSRFYYSSCHCFKPIKWNVCQECKKNSHKNVIEICKNVSSFFIWNADRSTIATQRRQSFILYSIFYILYVYPSIHPFMKLYMHTHMQCTMCVIHKTTKDWFGIRTKCMQNENIQRNVSKWITRSRSTPIRIFQSQKFFHSFFVFVVVLFEKFFYRNFFMEMVSGFVLAHDISMLWHFRCSRLLIRWYSVLFPVLLCFGDVFVFRFAVAWWQWLSFEFWCIDSSYRIYIWTKNQICVQNPKANFINWHNWSKLYLERKN